MASKQYKGGAGGSGGGESLSQTLLIGNDAAGLDGVNFGDLSLTGTLYDEDGMGLDIQTGGYFDLTIGDASTWTFNNTLTFAGSDFDFGGITGSLIVGGLGIEADTITELNASAGVTIAGSGGLKVNDIFNNGGDLTINVTGGLAALIDADGGVSIRAGVNASHAIETSGTGKTIITHASGDIQLVPDTGWTACTGTESKAGLDADNVIFTAGALQNLARTVAALQNILISKGYLTV